MQRRQRPFINQYIVSYNYIEGYYHCNYIVSLVVWYSVFYFSKDLKRGVTLVDFVEFNFNDYENGVCNTKLTRPCAGLVILKILKGFTKITRSFIPLVTTLHDNRV